MTEIDTATEHEETPAGEQTGDTARPDEGQDQTLPAATDTEEPTGDSEETEEPDTFPRSYVERLRNENADYRQRAKDRDDLAQRLHTTLVEATGRLADPDDLEFSEDHLADPEALTAAVDELLTRKPHLAARKPSGDVGQGVSNGSGSVDLAGMLRERA